MLWLVWLQLCIRRYTDVLTSSVKLNFLSLAIPDCV
jgi:hypothetical protein